MTLLVLIYISTPNLSHHMHFIILSTRICRQYDEMSDRMSEMPDTTEALVSLQEFLKQVRTINSLTILVRLVNVCICYHYEKGMV